MISGISNYIMKDFLSLFFLFLIVAISIPILIYSTGYMNEYRKKYSIKYFWLMMGTFILAMMGVVLSGDSICFLFFWELMSLSSFLLVIYDYTNKENIKSGILYFIMTHISGLFLILMFGMLYKYTGEMNFQAIMDKTYLLSNQEKLSILILGLIGFGTKAGLVPLHAWLPKAHPAAPSNISALMSGVMLKIALYGFIRVSFVFIKAAPLNFAIVVMILGACSALYSILNGLFQEDIKKLLAYSSAENIGIIFSVLGLSMIFNYYKVDELGLLALTAALFHILNHGIFKSLLFASAGSVLYGTSSKNMNELGGLYGKMKVTAICAFIGTAAISAVPPLNGFSSEILIFKSFIEAGSTIKNPEIVFLILLSGTVLAVTSGFVIWSAVKCFGITFLGSPRSVKAKEVHEIPKNMNIGMIILSGYAVLTGIFAPFIINFISNLSNNIRKLNLSIQGNTYGYEITIVAAILIVSVLFIIVIGKLADKNKTLEYNDTWGCGFNAPKPFIQYSGSGFTQPAARFIGKVACYEKEVRIKNTIFLRVRFTDLIEKYLYMNIIGVIDFIAGKIIKIHYGKIQAYISYIFISLIIALVLVINFV